MPTTTRPFWNDDISYWLRQLNSSAEGLSQKAADQRLAEAGIRVKGKSAFHKDLLLFIGQFKSPLMLLLIGAIIISAFLGDMSDVFIILSIVVSSGLLSFFQERNAGKIVEKLQSLISIKATVLRDGIPQEIHAERVVPGDVILLKAGDMLPADCLIMESNELHANESALTGESYPVRKEAGITEKQAALAKRTNCLWEGTSIVSGSAKALVIQTGDNTILGNMALRSSASIETAFEKGIKDFGFLLMKITLVLSVFILVINVINQKPIIDSALFALALAVGMAPELLPAVTTIAMSAGAKRLLEKKVIVKKLNSIQNLGEVNLLCTDKTGTITEGVIRVESIINGEGQESAFVRKLAFWNAFFETGYANPIDNALRQMDGFVDERVDKIGEIPYDFIRKRLSVAVRTEQERLLISKGAFPQIISICSKIRLNSDETADIALHRQALEAQFAQYGTEGLRVIAICYKTIAADTATISKEQETDMIFAGFILLNDPVKSGIAKTIDGLNQLHVQLKIITGDNKNVAVSIAKKIGISNPTVITGAEMLSTSPEALAHLAKDTHVFAEVEPQQKERIIWALKQHYTVAYMGDGINDVSAINAADVGISVDNAVDVAKEAADFVLMENNLTVLTDGIREGRKTFANTLKYIYINTGSTFGNMCSVAAASLILPFLPMLPKQILLINFISDFPFLAVSTDNVDEEQITKPGKWNLKLIRDYMFVFGLHSSLFDLITFSTLYFYLQAQETVFQTGWFVESTLTELFTLFIIRTHKSFLQSIPGKLLLILSVVSLVLTIGMPYMPFSQDIGIIPLPLPILGAMLLIVAVYVVTADLLKLWFFRKYHQP
jgi:Mg2+-importing ATPase